MIQFEQVTLRRGEKLLLENATFTVHAGWKVGLVGANGCGKSSLLKVLEGQIEPDAGHVTTMSRLRLASVSQELAAGPLPALDFVLQGNSQITALQAQLASAQLRDDGIRMAQLHAELEAAGVYRARALAASVLHGLGFTADQMNAAVDQLSGGWRMRLNLARALTSPSDMLLLDEPTNHLDLDAIIWLEDWLKQYQGTAWIVSHDRDFLDAVSTHIGSIEQKTLTLYTGNYSAFERQRASRMALQQAQFDKQQREIAHAREFVARFRAKASKAQQAQSRLKALERMELIAPAHVDAPFHFGFRALDALPQPLLTLRDGALGYGAKPVLEYVNMTLSPGDRIALIGPNGAGKSTLIKALAAQLAPRAGEIVCAKNLRIGYFAQHQLDQLRLEASPLAHLQALDKRARDQDLRDFLGGFGFHGDEAQAAIAPFSGGEKARLALALLVYQRPQLLLLDEPTNHLDIDMRQALTSALQDFSGAIVLVSHDRHLIRCVADTLLLVANGKVKEFDGDLDGYAQWLLESYRQSADSGLPEGSTVSRRDQRRVEAEQRQRLQPLRQKVKRLENELARRQERKTALIAELAEPAIYEASQKDKLKALLLEQRDNNATIAQIEEQWLDAAAELEHAAR